MTGLFLSLPIWGNLFFFTLAAVAVWVAGTSLSVYADEVSDRKRIGKAFTGFVFLAAATSLPELVTTIAGSLAGEALLVLNNVFGGITMQTAILAVADAAVPVATLTFYPRKPTPVLEAAILVVLLAVLLAVGVVGERELFLNVGIGAVFFALAYFGSISLLRSYEEASAWRPVDLPDEESGPFPAIRSEKISKRSTKGLVWLSIAMASVILIAGVALISLAEALAVQSGLGPSFIGVTLLAAVTSLPEVSTTIAAVRMGSFTMAISNIFGSNLIMLMLLLPADVFYRQGLILEKMDETATFALVSGIVVTGIYIIGLLLRHKKRFFGMGIDSVLVLAIYLASLGVFYFLR